jgi:hypothetical protein
MDEIERIKQGIANELSRLDYDSLIQVEAMIVSEKRSRPEELFY